MTWIDDVKQELLADRRREARYFAWLKAESEREKKAKERARRAGLIPYESPYVFQPNLPPYGFRTISDLTPSDLTPLKRTPTPPQNDNTWTTDTSPTAYKSAFADLSRSLCKPSSFRATDLSPSLQQSLINRGTGMYESQYHDNERHLVANLPAWMRSGDHHVAHSIGRTEDGRYLVDVPGLPSMYLDPQRKTYVPLQGFHGDEAMATEMVRRRLQGH